MEEKKQKSRQLINWLAHFWCFQLLMKKYENTKKKRRKYRKSRIADEWARYPVDPPMSAGQSQSRHSDAEEHVEEVFVFVFILNINI